MAHLMSEDSGALGKTIIPKRDLTTQARSILAGKPYSGKATAVGIFGKPAENVIGPLTPDPVPADQQIEEMIFGIPVMAETQQTTF
jgi:hypothetical protein